MTFRPLRAQDLTGTIHHAEPLQLTLLEPATIDALYDIEQSVHSHPWSRKLFEQCIGTRQHCLVIRQQQAIAGYLIVCAAAGNAELLNIAVSPSFQRRGIARCALLHVIDKLQGIADTLYLEVRQSNRPAIALYDDIGFVEVGLRPNYYPAEHGREDAVIMAYPLPGDE